MVRWDLGIRRPTISSELFGDLLGKRRHFLPHGRCVCLTQIVTIGDLDSRQTDMLCVLCGGIKQCELCEESSQRGGVHDRVVEADD